MTDRELMQMALEVLEKLNKDGWILADFEEEVYASIEALRARLAGWERVNMHDHKEGDLGIGMVKWDASAPLVVTPHPAFKKPWVGLTDEEIIACIQRGKSDDLGDYVKPLATSRAVEAKLKEKNT